ncbi:MAG: insulinase family protein [Dysgonamonadaceae bacterium]|jgi:predicted Zn-dependent peptidase|nr:insulinase family protein [Dysgonamonadaceae bacterium]
MKKLVLLLAIAVWCSFTVGAKKKADQKVNIEFAEYDLNNGLHVILHKDASTPNVIVPIMYHVGTKNETPDKTGFAHFFEHLMFEGSQNIGRGEYMKIVEENGGALNANTSPDRTYYFELMPSNQLELALWMESERMLHAKIDSIGIATQKGVVIEERKQTMESRPYGLATEKLGEKAFTVHPYRWSVLGYPEHIRTATDEEIYHFYKTYYVPDNAVLVISGDFDEKQTKEWVEKYFAGIPKGIKPIARPNIVEPPQTTEIRDTVYDKIQLPGIFMGYHAPAMGTKDAHSLQVLCQILYGGASSRMKANITDKGLALEAFVYPLQQEDPGLIYVFGIVNGGVAPETLEEAINEEFEKVQNELVSEDEFQMSMAAKEFSIASDLSTTRRVSEYLANNFTYFKDSGRINRELDFYSTITREDLMEVARKYFAKNNRVVLYYLPESEEK